MLSFGAVCLACLAFARRSIALGVPTAAVYAVTAAMAAIALSWWPGFDEASVRYFVAAVIIWARTVRLALHM